MNRSADPSLQAGPTDEQLMSRLAEGERDALSLLFGRYAPLVYRMAAQSLGRAAAEDMVQEVFLALWRKVAAYDSRKGPFRPWLLQIAHFRILNELRRRGRGPQLDPDADDHILEELPDASGEPAEEAWRRYRKEAVRAAVERLPAAQRQALSLAFFEDLTHDQVADALKIPLGTVKTRIRSAVRKLRYALIPLGIAMLLIAALLGLGLQSRLQLAASQRTERALAFVTASDITTLHLAAAPGLPAATHGSYRGRKGTALAVMALHGFAPPPAGKIYQGWAGRGGVWVSVGTAYPDADGNALIIGEAPALAELPDMVEVTLEPAAGNAAPAGPLIIEWHGSNGKQ